MQIANSEIAPARDANARRSHQRHGARSAPLGAIALAVFIAVVVRAFASALPFELATKPLAAFAAQCARRGLAEVAERDRPFLVGIGENVDVKTLEDHLLARHFLVGHSRQAGLGRPCNERSAGYPDHALAWFRGDLRRRNRRARRALRRAFARRRCTLCPARDA